MSPKTSPAMPEDEDTRGRRGCFGWFFRLFKKIKRRCRPKKKKTKPSLEGSEETNESLVPVNSVAVLTEEDGRAEASVSVMTVAEVTEELEACDATATAEAVGEERQKEQDDEELVEEQQEPQVVMPWAEEVDEAEETGLDVFTSQSSCLPHTAIVPCERSASPEKEATAAAASPAKMSASQKRRARRKALHAARVNGEARLAATTEEPPRQDRTHVWPSPSVRVFGSDGRPFVTTWEEAAYGAFRAQRHY